MFHDTHMEVRGTTNNPQVSVFSFRPVGAGDRSGWQAWQLVHSLHSLSLLQSFGSFLCQVVLGRECALKSLLGCLL